MMLYSAHVCALHCACVSTMQTIIHHCTHNPTPSKDTVVAIRKGGHKLVITNVQSDKYPDVEFSVDPSQPVDTDNHTWANYFLASYKVRCPRCFSSLPCLMLYMLGCMHMVDFACTSSYTEHHHTSSCTIMYYHAPSHMVTHYHTGYI